LPARRSVVARRRADRDLAARGFRVPDDETDDHDEQHEQGPEQEEDAPVEPGGYAVLRVSGRLPTGAFEALRSHRALRDGSVAHQGDEHGDGEEYEQASHGEPGV